MFTESPLLIKGNVKFHQSANIKALLNGLGVEVLYLPPYSPDLNPIENLFGTLKAKLNQIRPRASSKDQLLRNINSVLESFTDGFINYFRSFRGRINQILNGFE